MGHDAWEGIEEETTARHIARAESEVTPTHDEVIVIEDEMTPSDEPLAPDAVARLRAMLKARVPVVGDRLGHFIEINVDDLDIREQVHAAETECRDDLAVILEMAAQERIAIVDKALPVIMKTLEMFDLHTKDGAMTFLAELVGEQTLTYAVFGKKVKFENGAPVIESIGKLERLMYVAQAALSFRYLATGMRKLFFSKQFGAMAKRVGKHAVKILGERFVKQVSSTNPQKQTTS